MNKPDEKTPVDKTGSGTQGRERNVGDALRAVYREAVREDIPDEMLDLLKKLD